MMHFCCEALKNWSCWYCRPTFSTWKSYALSNCYKYCKVVSRIDNRQSKMDTSIWSAASSSPFPLPPLQSKPMPPATAALPALNEAMTPLVATPVHKQDPVYAPDTSSQSSPAASASIPSGEPALAPSPLSPAPGVTLAKLLLRAFILMCKFSFYLHLQQGSSQNCLYKGQKATQVTIFKYWHVSLAEILNTEIRRDPYAVHKVTFDYRDASCRLEGPLYWTSERCKWKHQIWVIRQQPFMSTVWTLQSAEF